MEFNSLPDLLNTGLTIIEIGLFYGGEHLKAKICRFLTRSLQDGYFWSKIRDDEVWKHFKYWLSSSNVSIKTLNLLSKGDADKF